MSLRVQMLCRREGRVWSEAGTNYCCPDVRTSGIGPGTRLYCICHFVFLRSSIICQRYKLNSSFQSRVTLQMRVGLSDLMYIYFIFLMAGTLTSEMLRLKHGSVWC